MDSETQFQDTSGDWQDAEDDEEFERQLVRATQQAEEEQEQKKREEALRLRSANRNDEQRSSNSNEKRVNPNVLFNSRRQHLPLAEDSEVIMDFSERSSYSFSSNSSPSKKPNFEELKTQLQRSMGEANMLRKQYEQVRQELQSKTVDDMRRGQQQKQAHDKEVQELKKNLAEIKEQLRKTRFELANLSTKPPSMQGNRLSIGGSSKSQGYAYAATGSKNAKKVQMTLNTSVSPKSRSDPNLITQTQAQRMSPVTPSPQSPQLSFSGVDASTQADLDFEKLRLSEEIKKAEGYDERVFQDGKIKIGESEAVLSLKSSSLRKDIFLNLKRLIELEFEMVEPTLHSVINDLPLEIQRNYVVKRKRTQNHCFQGDIVETLFQYFNDVKRKQDSLKRGKPLGLPPPKIPDKHAPCVINLKLALKSMEAAFLQEGAYSALSQLKLSLMKLLDELTKEKRLRLFEFGNMTAYWTLLAWTKHLWKFIIFEEELKPERTEKEEKEWISGLNSWTGLVLKADWRDLYLPKLETVVRSLSLNILESIVVAGFFEQEQRRYEILYSIIKDTLLKDHLRTHVMVRQCIVITTWAISYRPILKYLCFEQNNGNCLAQIMGENVLQCFKDTEDPHDATNLLVCYLNLLEALMLKEPFPKAASTIGQSKIEREVEAMGKPKKVLQGIEEDTQIFSQFADTNKYKFEKGSKARSEKFNDIVKVDCWIKPSEWEAHKGKPQKCQCRKFLLGNVFIMLQQVIDFWKKSYLETVNAIEENEIEEWKEFRKMESLDSEGKEEMKKKIDSFREFVLQKMKTPEPVPSREYCIEKTWEQMINTDSFFSTDQLKAAPEPPIPSVPDWIEEKRKPENIFDYVLRRSIYFIKFCERFSTNVANAIGSKQFTALKLLLMSLRFYSKEVGLSDIERSFLDDLDEVEENMETRRTLEGFEVDEDDLGIDEEFDGVILPDLDVEFLLSGEEDVDWSTPPDPEELNKWFNEQWEREEREQKKELKSMKSSSSRSHSGKGK